MQMQKAKYILSKIKIPLRRDFFILDKFHNFCYTVKVKNFRTLCALRA